MVRNDVRAGQGERIIITVDGKINRWEGWLLLLFYAFFIGHLYGLA